MISGALPHFHGEESAARRKRRKVNVNKYFTVRLAIVTNKTAPSEHRYSHALREARK